MPLVVPLGALTADPAPIAPPAVEADADHDVLALELHPQ
jgi:hypothetical protein